MKNKKRAENIAADHLSRLENLHLEELRDGDIDDNFHDETLMNISSTEEDKIPGKKKRLVTHGLEGYEFEEFDLLVDCMMVVKEIENELLEEVEVEWWFEQDINDEGEGDEEDGGGDKV
nr:reverse transcriptase domain-containing protein [Tanacetum cinerariifolium]